MESDKGLETVNYRLSTIERTLTELKNVVLENKLQARDIKELSDRNKEILNAINAHESRIKTLENRPVKEKADRFQYIIDYIFKALVVGLCAMAASRFGFPQ